MVDLEINKDSQQIALNDLRRGHAKSSVVATAIHKVLESGHWIHGSEHKSFESELADFLSVNHLFGVASGTDALEIALRAVGCSAGSKVITVANAGGYTPIAAASIGCEVIYCDVDTEKLLIDPKSLAPLLSNEITAVVVTHLYGNVAPVSTIIEMCEPYGIKVIEDCAQAIGAIEYSNHVGTIGHIGTFSFYPTKNLGGIGDGGAVATNESEIAQKVKDLRQYGWSSKYKIDLAGGMNSRLDEIQAAVLRIGLPQLDTMNQKRRQIVEQYSKAVEHSNIRLVTSFEVGNVAHLAVLELPKEVNRHDFQKYLKDLGILTDVHYPILDCDQIGLIDGTGADQLPNSRSSVNRIVSIPLFPELEDFEVKRICDALRNYAT